MQFTLFNGTISQKKNARRVSTTVRAKGLCTTAKKTYKGYLAPGQWQMVPKVKNLDHNIEGTTDVSRAFRVAG